MLTDPLSQNKLAVDVMTILEEILGYAHAEQKHQGFVRITPPRPNTRVTVTLEDSTTVDKLRDGLSRFVILEKDYICGAANFLPPVSTTPTTSITSTYGPCVP